MERGDRKRGYYFARIDVNTGEIMGRDFVPGDGMYSKIRLPQVEEGR